MSVVHSRLLYGATVWADEVQNVAKYQNIMLQSRRCAALRVARCYRTVSDMAALVLARMPPVTVQAAVRKRVIALKNEGVILSVQLKEDDTMSRWQAMWDASTKAEWTKFLIPNLRRWWSQGPREVSYHMKRKIATNPGCVDCLAVFDDAEHTVFNCPF